MYVCLCAKQKERKKERKKERERECVCVFLFGILLFVVVNDASDFPIPREISGLPKVKILNNSQREVKKKSNKH